MTAERLHSRGFGETTLRTEKGMRVRFHNQAKR